MANLKPRRPATAGGNPRLKKRTVLNPSDVKDAEALQKIVDRALQKPGVEPYPDFDAFLEELNRWEMEPDA